MGDSRRARLAARVLCAGACGFACAGCARDAGAAALPVLHAGTRATAAAGLRLAPDPVVFVHDLQDRLDPRPGIVELDDDEDVVVSGDRRHAAIVRVADGKTRIVLDGGAAIERQGAYGVRLGRDGQVLALSAPEPRIPGASAVVFLDRDGAPLASVTVAGMRWIEASIRGERFAIGSDEGVRVLARDGTELVRLDAADAGALSPDGAWVALERAGEIELVSLTNGGHGAPWTQPVTASAVLLAAIGPGRLLRVAPDRLQVFELATGTPVLALDRAPPAGFAWRDALVEEDGTLLASRIRIDKRPRRERGPGGARHVEGSARVVIEELAPGSRASREIGWNVSEWNSVGPELASAGRERRYALVWPSAMEVRIP